MLLMEYLHEIDQISVNKDFLLIAKKKLYIFIILCIQTIYKLFTDQ